MRRRSCTRDNCLAFGRCREDLEDLEGGTRGKEGVLHCPLWVPACRHERYLVWWHQLGQPSDRYFSLVAHAALKTWRYAVKFRHDVLCTKVKPFERVLLIFFFVNLNDLWQF